MTEDIRGNAMQIGDHVVIYGLKWETKEYGGNTPFHYWNHYAIADANLVQLWNEHPGWAHISADSTILDGLNSFDMPNHVDVTFHVSINDPDTKDSTWDCQRNGSDYSFNLKK